ncbi:MAG: hypothetical protein ABSE73_24010 [Planctomycetota bacterium]
MRFSLATLIVATLVASVCLGGSAIPHRENIGLPTIYRPRWKEEYTEEHGWPVVFSTVAAYIDRQPEKQFDLLALVVDIAVAIGFVVAAGCLCEWWLRHAPLSRKCFVLAMVTGLLIFSGNFTVCNYVRPGHKLGTLPEGSCYGWPFDNYSMRYEVLMRYYFMGIAGNLAFWCIVTLALWAGVSCALRRSKYRWKWGKQY